MTKRKYKEERKKILEKYGRLSFADLPDNEVKDTNGCWIWLRDSIDYKRQGQKGSVLTQIKVEYRNLIYKTVGSLRKSRGVRNWTTEDTKYLKFPSGTRK